MPEARVAATGAHPAGRLAKVLVAIVLLGYPVAIYLLRGRFSPSQLLAGLLALLGLRTLVSAWVLRRRVAWQVALALLLWSGAAVVWLAFADVHMRWLRLYPMLLDLGVAAIFLGSLASGRPLVERIARAFRPDLPVEAVAYTRRVTIAWGVLMVLVALVSLYTALGASLRIWSLFNGAGAYVVIGLAFVLEYALRWHLKRKWRRRERLA